MAANITIQQRLVLLNLARDGQGASMASGIEDLAAENGISPGEVISAIKDNMDRGLGHYTAMNPAVTSRAAFAHALTKFTPQQIGLQRGIINDRDQLGDTPFMVAARYGNVPMMRVLIGQGALWGVNNNYHETAVHKAAQGRSTAAIDYLAELGASMNVQNRKGTPPMHYAVHANDQLTLNCLMRHGANRHAQDHDGYSALHIAASQGHTDAVEQLVRNNLNMSQPARNGFTALHSAVWAGQTLAVTKLLSLGAQPNLRANPSGDTPLHLAVKTVNLDIVDALLATRGCNATIKNSEGKSPLQLAEDGGLGEVEAIFRQYNIGS